MQNINQMNNRKKIRIKCTYKNADNNTKDYPKI